MLTLIERLECMRNEADGNEHVRSQPYRYAGADIESWHINFRSLLDQVALVISGLAGVKNEKLKKSFRRLYDRTSHLYLRTPEGKAFGHQMGPELVELLQSATWFNQIVSVRDEIVHRGGHTLVFEDPSKGILFQVYGGRYLSLVKNSPLMFNGNVVFFDRYAAHLMAHLLILLERFAGIVYERMLKSQKPEESARNYSGGWGTLRSWIDSTLAAAGPLTP